jgi:hypothetical protein
MLAKAATSPDRQEDSMKRLISIASFAVLLCIALFTSSLAQAPAAPSMVLPERSFDFKEVEEGKVAEHTFKVLNKGNRPLEITNVNPG